jgi:phage recombination protein Bet
MSNELTTTNKTSLACTGNDDLISVLQNSLYPGANPKSIAMVLGYCQSAGLDPMQKPVHIVPMWDSKTSSMRDLVMPGIGLYRTQASRTNQCAGISEPEFGPDVTATIGGEQVTYPAWCKMSVKRLMSNGGIAEFVAVERWIENYAIKGGKEKSVAPNAMWKKRPYAQLSKCAESQALRKAFPELTGAAPTAEEMEGKTIGEYDDGATIDATTGEVTSKYDAVLLKIYEAATVEALNSLRPEILKLPADDKKAALSAAVTRADEIRAASATEVVDDAPV